MRKSFRKHLFLVVTRDDNGQFHTIILRMYIGKIWPQPPCCESLSHDCEQNICQIAACEGQSWHAPCSCADDGDSQSTSALFAALNQRVVQPAADFLSNDIFRRCGQGGVFGPAEEVSQCSEIIQLAVDGWCVQAACLSVICAHVMFEISRYHMSDRRHPHPEMAVFGNRETFVKATRLIQKCPPEQNAGTGPGRALDECLEEFRVLERILYSKGLLVFPGCGLRGVFDDDTCHLVHTVNFGRLGEKRNRAKARLKFVVKNIPAEFSVTPLSPPFCACKVET